MPSEEKSKTLGSEMTLFDTLLNGDLRLTKKYLLDAEGKLKLYHPITQRILWMMMNGETPNLHEELQTYHEEQKLKKNKKDC